MELQTTVQLPAGQNTWVSEAGAVCREGQAGCISLFFFFCARGHRVDPSLPLHGTKGPEPHLFVQNRFSL